MEQQKLPPVGRQLGIPVGFLLWNSFKNNRVGTGQPLWESSLRACKLGPIAA